MEEESEQIPQEEHKKTIFVAIVLILLIITGFILFTRSKSLSQVGVSHDNSMIVMVENTKIVNGVMRTPSGFPLDIPIEDGRITESATTRYPREGLRQLSLAYRSLKTVTEKYNEYKEYMQQSGFNVTKEEDKTSSMLISGDKGNVSLNVSVNPSGRYTTVNLSYLEK